MSFNIWLIVTFILLHHNCPYCTLQIALSQGNLYLFTLEPFFYDSNFILLSKCLIMNKFTFEILLLMFYEEICYLTWKTHFHVCLFCFLFLATIVTLSFSFSSLLVSKVVSFFFKICLNIAATKQPFILCLQSFTPIVVIHKKKRKEREREGEKRRKEIENFAF